MAASAFTVFNKAKEKLADGTFDLDTHTFKMALCGASQALSAAFAGTSTDCRYSDLTDQLANGNGYTTGGVTLTGVTWTESSGTLTFDCNNPQWTGLTKTGIKYGVIYDDSDTNKGLLCFFELESGSTINVTAGTLDVTINAAGVFTLA